ncbi:DUF5058 family protein [Nocardioides insulae]|uniref:DUF5058 family protein n=1 Tax=Nocardioides insulae TaxID=394734 RepID=UPI0003FA70E1|nr:DUF5058 family protein [Nocardioides insulae]
MFTPHTAVDPSSTDILAIANQPYLWVTAVGVFVVIGLQSIIYFRAARKAGPEAGLTRQESIKAYRAGMVASIGPSLAVCLIAITLISVFGTPAVLVRIGLIGSAAYEVGAAGIAANTQDAQLGGDDYTQQIFATSLLAMSLAGAMWMVVTLIATPLLKRGTERLSAGKGATAMAIVPGAALLGAFGTFGLQQIAAGMGPALVTAASALVMAICLFIAKSFNQHWLREWGLGISLLCGLVTGLLLTQAGIA